MRTEVLSAATSESRPRAIKTAVTLLRKGEIVALPTETVYGLAADALNSEAVARIFEAKERPRFDPLIVHLPDPTWLERIARIDNDIRELLGSLVSRFWPGPFTIVLLRRDIVPDLVAAGLETVAVRVSAHSLFDEVIREFGSPLAAPSANRFGRVSPTTAQHVVDELGGRIPLVLDSGPTSHGIESTIVALRNGKIEMLRRGPITAEDLSEFGDVVAGKITELPEAPGQLQSHYAPTTPVVLIEQLSTFSPPPGKRCGLLAWSPAPDGSKFAETRQLSERQDLKEAAANLFRLLRELDRSEVDLIVAEKVPDYGVGAAINERLGRAASYAS